MSRRDRPSRARFRRLAENHARVPVVRTLLGDCDTPVSAYKKLGAAKGSFLLESVEGGETWGRYSILGAAATGRFHASGGRVRWEWKGRSREKKTDDPLRELRGWIRRQRAATLPGLPRFCGGAVGYVAYDAIHPNDPRQQPPDAEIELLLVEDLVVFDNLSHTIQLIASAPTGTGPDRAYDAARARLDALEHQLRAGLPADGGNSPRRAAPAFRSDMRRRRFERGVRRVKEYVRAGDCFQVVLSHEMSAALQVPSLDVYRALRTINPSPYMFHVDFGERQLLGASPEVLVRVEDKEALVRPIAGTRARGRTRQEDDRRIADLLGDEKERAEHVMLVDLGRNDLGRVCAYDSVETGDFMRVEKYSHVIHLVSDVRGTLRDDADCFDALRACFPAGTVSGAPKVRAMEIIEELEGRQRGVYAGAVGYFSFDGSMDTCIAIRTALVERGRIRMGVGAGIVLDSEPAREWEETQEKVHALRAAIERAERGLD